MRPAVISVHDLLCVRWQVRPKARGVRVGHLPFASLKAAVKYLTKKYRAYGVRVISLGPVIDFHIPKPGGVFDPHLFTAVSLLRSRSLGKLVNFFATYSYEPR